MEWKNIFESGYAVSNEGDIRKPNGKLIRFRSSGYRTCDLGMVHQIVAYFFLPHPNAKQTGRFCFEGYEVHHKDRNPWNNSVDNLIYLTEEEHKAVHKKRKIKIEKSKREIFNELFINI